MLKVNVTQDCSQISISFDESDHGHLFGISADRDTSVEGSYWISEEDGLKNAIKDIKNFFSGGFRPDNTEGYEITEPYEEVYKYVVTYSQYLAIDFGDKYLTFIDFEQNCNHRFDHLTRARVDPREDLLGKLEAGLKYIKSGKIDITRLSLLETVEEVELPRLCESCGR